MINPRDFSISAIDAKFPLDVTNPRTIHVRDSHSQSQRGELRSR